MTSSSTAPAAETSTPVNGTPAPGEPHHHQQGAGKAQCIHASGGNSCGVQEVGSAANDPLPRDVRGAGGCSGLHGDLFPEA